MAIIKEYLYKFWPSIGAFFMLLSQFKMHSLFWVGMAVIVLGQLITYGSE